VSETKLSNRIVSDMKKDNKVERCVLDIIEIPNGVRFLFDDMEYADILRFGIDLITSPSEGVLKKTLVNIKKDVITYKFNVEKLKTLWINNKQ
jgi:hypothetical protein